MHRRIFLVGLVATACGSQATNAIEPSSSILLAEEPPPTTTTTIAPTTTTVAQTTTTSTIPPNANRTWIAMARGHVTGLSPLVTPNGTSFEMPWFQPNPHQFGTPLTLMVTEGQPGDDWVKVQLPIRPNGQEAWVPTTDYRISSIFHRAEVNLTTQRVVVWEDGDVLAQTDAVVGGASSPTPFGSFYVASSVEDYFGEPALVLSSFSEVLDTFDGGLPVIAIHRTFGEGQESDDNVGSNGCVRVPVETIRFLAEHVPLGTPVDFIA